MNKRSLVQYLVGIILLLLCSCSNDSAGSGSLTGNAFVSGVVQKDTTSSDSVFVAYLVPEEYLPNDEELEELIQVDTVNEKGEFTFVIDDTTLSYSVLVEGDQTGALLRGQSVQHLEGNTIKSLYKMRPYGAIKVLSDTGLIGTSDHIVIEGTNIKRDVNNVTAVSDSTMSFVVNRIPTSEYTDLYKEHEEDVDLFIDESFFVNPEDTVLVTNVTVKGVMTPFNSGLPSYAVYTISIDKSDRLWFGTQTGIIGIYNNYYWSYININSYGLYSSVLDVTFEQDSSMWCGTNVGVAHFNGYNFSYYNTKNSGLPANSVHGITIDEEGNRWFATFGGGVAKFTQDEKWIVYNTNNSDLPSDYILRVRSDDFGNVWAICNRGVALFNGEDWDVYNKATTNKISCDTVSASAFNGNESWFASVNGSIVLKDSYDEWHHFDHTNSPLLKDSPIFAMFIDSKKRLWAANSDGEIYIYKDRKWNVFNHETNECIPEKTGRMISIVEDKEGRIWVATEAAGVIEFSFEGTTLDE